MRKSEGGTEGAEKRGYERGGGRRGNNKLHNFTLIKKIKALQKKIT